MDTSCQRRVLAPPLSEVIFFLTMMSMVMSMAMVDDDDGENESGRVRTQV